MDTKKSFKDSVVRAVALIGLLLVLLLGAWGVILLATNLPTIASNVGSSIVSLFTFSPSGSLGSVSPVTITAPASAKSGTAFTVSWEGDNAANTPRVYSVSYACKSGLSIKAPTPNGSYQTAPCATPFNYVNAGSKMTLIAENKSGATMDATIIVSAANANDNAVVASGSATVSITPVSTAAVKTTEPGVKYVPAARTTSLYGAADLAVRILSINSLSSVQGRVAVQFEVENIGTNIAPAGWMFTANLPVGYAYTYSSPTQQALYPGDKIVYTLGFNSTYQNQYCTMQYPNQNCPWYQEPYQPYPYQGTCYRYDGYQNLPVSCPSGVNPNYDYYNSNNSNLGGYYSNRIVTIIVDPRNYIYDFNRGNNTASIPSPIY